MVCAAESSSIVMLLEGGGQYSQWWGGQLVFDSCSNPVGKVESLKDF